MHKIDFVIAWVDGSDPVHQKKRAQYEPNARIAHSDAVLDTRFRHCGEIYYCIASILKYAKFANKIWIITDQQKPKYLDAFAKSGLCQPDFIQVIDHKTVFKGVEFALPTFSSISIESVMWRIPRLTEKFIYMNDDFFFNSPATQENLFKNGKPILRGWLAQQSQDRLTVRIRRFLRKVTFRPPNNRPSYRITQELGAKLAGHQGPFLHVGHHPHPMRKSVSQRFYEDHGMHILKNQISYRFRDVAQYNQVSLANHLEMVNHGVDFGQSIDVAYFKPKIGHAHRAVFDSIRNDVEPYGCLQSLDLGSNEQIAELQELMSKKFGRYLPKGINPALPR